MAKNEKTAATSTKKAKNMVEMSIIEAAFNGIDSSNETEYKRFVEDLKVASEDTLTAYRNHELKDAKRSLEDAMEILDAKKSALEKAKKLKSPDAIKEAMSAALKDCRKKGPETTFNDVFNAINPHKADKAIKEAEDAVKEAQAVVDEHQKTVEYYEQVIEVVKYTCEQLFGTTIAVPATDNE